MVLQDIAPVGNATSATVLTASLLAWIPPSAALIGSLLGILWFVICITESRTYQHWRNNLRMKHRARKLARLKAQEKIVIAEILALEALRAARVEARELVEGAKADAAVLVVQAEQETP